MDKFLLSTVKKSHKGYIIAQENQLLEKKNTDVE